MTEMFGYLAGFGVVIFCMLAGGGILARSDRGKFNVKLADGTEISASSVKDLTDAMDAIHRMRTGAIRG